MGQKVRGYRRNAKYGENSLRIQTKKEEGILKPNQSRSWRFEVNPEGTVGWESGAGGRKEGTNGDHLNQSRGLREEIEEVRVNHGCVSNGLGRKGRPERGYGVYGEYTYPDEKERERAKAGEEKRRLKEEGKKKKQASGKEGSSQSKSRGEKRKRYEEAQLKLGRLRVKRKYEKRRGKKVEIKRTDLKKRRKESGLEEEKRKRVQALGPNPKRRKPSERCDAIARSGSLPIGQRRANLRARELEEGLNHIEVRRKVEKRRDHHAKDVKYGRKKEGLVELNQTRGEKRKSGYYGYQLVVKGPLGGGRRTTTYVKQDGCLPLGTKKARRRTWLEPSKTKIGSLGVKVSYCYGVG
jgi:hypothetical protein